MEKEIKNLIYDKRKRPIKVNDILFYFNKKMVYWELGRKFVATLRRYVG